MKKLGLDPDTIRPAKSRSSPDKEVPILLAAIEARATHLFTGDLRHFGPCFGKKVSNLPTLFHTLRSLCGTSAVSVVKTGEAV